MKKWLAIVLVGVVVLGLWFFLSDDEGGTGSDAGGDAGGVETVEIISDTGAAFDMSLEDFSKKFNSVYKDTEKPLKFEEVEVNLKDCWETPEKGIDDSDAEYEYYSANVNGIRIGAYVYDEKVATVLVDFTVIGTNEREYATILSTVLIKTCGNLTDEQAKKVFERSTGSTLNYINGVLYYSSESDCFVARAASDSYVQSRISAGAYVNDTEHWNNIFLV